MTIRKNIISLFLVSYISCFIIADKYKSWKGNCRGEVSSPVDWDVGIMDVVWGTPAQPINVTFEVFVMTVMI